MRSRRTLLALLALMAVMALYYCRPRHGNFGDELNPWLWSRLAPEVCPPNDWALFLGIGTLLSHKVPKPPIKVVFGSGCGAGAPPVIDERWFFYAVRGPATVEKLKLQERKLALGDPAILVRRFVVENVITQFPVSFMPHHQSMLEAEWEALCARAGLHCINPRRTVEEVLLEIRQTKLLLTEALHGAIVADALRVPWIPVRLYGNFLEFKWLDWTRSLDIALTINSIPPIYARKALAPRALLHASKKVLANAGLGKQKWNYLRARASSEKDIESTLQALNRLAREGKPYLSEEATLLALEAALIKNLEELRADWKQGRFRNEA